MVNRLILFFLTHKPIVFLLLAAILAGGAITAPFSSGIGDIFFGDRRISVDAIPDLGENQQIVFTNWPGRSPQDIESQITYPLSTTLTGVAGVKTIRSSSDLGFSSIYLIFEEDTDFFQNRSRILEKLNALPPGILPENVRPQLGPDATALGQVFSYTLEGRDKQGNPTGGWDLHEIRSAQDFTVRYALASVAGVAEVASVGGFLREYQIDLDPAAMKAYGVSLSDVMESVRNTNLDVGARTLEVNRVEYTIRGQGYVKSIQDIEDAVVIQRAGVSVRIRQVARVFSGPAPRQGALDKEGAEVVGGIVVVRYGANPQAVIESVKQRIQQLSPGLPRKTLRDGTVSQLTIVPFYDRSELIAETLDTLEIALILEVLITVLVIVLMMRNLGASLLISGMLPVAVGATFILMKFLGTEANIVSLAGIAIAIGTMVDMAIVMVENIFQWSDKNDGPISRKKIFEAAKEVSPAILTAILTTIVSFLPVFFMEGPEGKLFKPLAITKTLALVSALVITLAILPAFAHLGFRIGKRKIRLPFFRQGFGELGLTVLILLLLLTRIWAPLGKETAAGWQFLFTTAIMVFFMGIMLMLEKYYTNILSWCMEHKRAFFSLPVLLSLFALYIWRGLGNEFMPALDEGSFLLMPTSMPHSGIEENLEILQQLDQAVAAIPEVEKVVGKLGRAESALDPAPISMYENLIRYKSEYAQDSSGKIFRQWRDHIRSPDDIWKEIVAIRLPGVTTAPKLQPIETRQVMLQTGMRAPMGIKVRGSSLDSIQAFSAQLEPLLKSVENIQPETVFADRILAKPYLTLELNREKMARYGLTVKSVQEVIEVGIGGMTLSQSVEGRERYDIRLRFARELRDDPDRLARLPISLPNGGQIPLSEVVSLRYTSGPQMIRAEDNFLVTYVLFDRKNATAEVEVVESARQVIEKNIASGQLHVPAGVSFEFSGNYQHHLRAQKKLLLIVPFAIAMVFALLYLQFKSVITSLMVFSGIWVAFCGGMLLLGLYSQPGFMAISLGGFSMRDIFQIETLNLSVAVWVGFIALFGIATDDGVVMATYLRQVFEVRKPATKEAVRDTVKEAGRRRIKPCLMTTATTVIALLPIMTATGRGSDIMIPMAVPVFGGMMIELITLFIVPVLYAAWQEKMISKNEKVK
ncbi:MAG: efflux RND transporter permease subunit [Bacteroidia bacterium]|nr:efflux RND transporter permease subunit [Bacteroidia bacterium]